MIPTQKLATIIIFLLGTYPAVGQSLLPDSIPHVERNLWKVNFLLPGAEYERALGEVTTVNVNPYFGLGYSSNFALGDAWSVQPSLDVQFRRYYNLLRRAAKGKRTSGNSGNFVALDLIGVGRSIVDREARLDTYYYGLGPVWGLQRTYRSNFNLSFQAGGAYVTNGFGDETFLLRLNLRLGLALKRRR